jgi:hypothetical protein
MKEYKCDICKQKMGTLDTKGMASLPYMAKPIGIQHMVDFQPIRETYGEICVSCCTKIKEFIDDMVQ